VSQLESGVAVVTAEQVQRVYLLYLLYDKQVSQLESDVAVERSNVRNEEERVKLEKERHNERVKVLLYQ
jgi:hypothetical protein